MLNVTWARGFSARNEGLTTPAGLPMRLLPVLEQPITHFRNVGLDQAQRLFERAMRHNAARPQARRVFHAAAMGPCVSPETSSVDSRSTASARVDLSMRPQTKPSDPSATTADRADDRQTTSTGTSFTTPTVASVPHSVFNASFAQTLISPGFFMVRPPPAFIASIRFSVTPANELSEEDEPRFGDDIDRYGDPAYTLLSAIAGGTQLHENFLYVSQVIRAFARALTAPARQLLNRSGDFFELMAGLNATLAGKRRLTSLTLVVLHVMRRNSVDYDEASEIDAALQSVTALHLAQQKLSAADSSVTRHTTMPGGSTTHSPSPSGVDAVPTASSASEAVSEYDVTTGHFAPTDAARRIACAFGVVRADEGNLVEGGLMALSWLDGVPMIWAPDAVRTFAWRSLPLEPYEVDSDAQNDMPADVSMCFAQDGQSYIRIFGRTFRVVETPCGTLQVVGPEDRSLPPLPLVKLPDGWDFARPDDETHTGDDDIHPLLNAIPIPSEDGFVRWKNKKFICYGDQLRPVARSRITGEAQIRAMAIQVVARLDQPDDSGILWGADGQRLIEGQHGYYSLLDEAPRIGLQGSIYRIGSPGGTSTMSVSYDRVRQRWHVLGVQRPDAWFSNAFDPANHIRAAYRRLNARLALRLDATVQALPDVPFLKTRRVLHETLHMSCTRLVTRILRFQSRPSTWSPDEPERLRSIWSALTNLLPVGEQWKQMPLVQRQLLLAENTALFYDEFAPSFPLNGVLHQAQMTALGMDALDGTLPGNAVVQLNARLISADGFSPHAADMLLYVDSPALLTSLLTSFLHPMSHDGVLPIDTDWHRTSFAAWLYEHRGSVALINFSARGGLRSFENVSSAAQVADAVDLFLWEKPPAEGLSFAVSPRDPM